MTDRPIPQAQPVPRLALSIVEAAQAIGCGRRLVWELTNRGELPVVKAGRRVLIPTRELQDWLSRQAAGGKTSGRRPAPTIDSRKGGQP